ARGFLAGADRLPFLARGELEAHRPGLERLEQEHRRVLRVALRQEGFIPERAEVAVRVLRADDPAQTGDRRVSHLEADVLRLVAERRRDLLVLDLVVLVVGERRAE